MNEIQIQGRISWLCAGLEARRNDITKILQRLVGIGFYAATSFAVHIKFLHLMDQIAEDKKKELDILYEIETVEKHHCELKRLKLLRHADLNASKKVAPSDEIQEEEKPHRSSLLKILALIFLFSPQGQKQNFQKPEID